MTYDEFLDRVIDEGVLAARRDYTKPGKEQQLRGAVAGFLACRGCPPEELGSLLEAADSAVADAIDREAADFWWFRCYQAEVGWVCNVVSALLVNEGRAPLVAPTLRGVKKAAEILGTAAP